MNFLDTRTVIFSQLITDALCTGVLAILWLQNRKRYAGMLFWVADFIFQTTAALLLILRGSIPDWISVGFTSILVLGGALLGYLGLERFVGKRSSQIYNYILLGALILVHFYFVYIHPDLAARDLNVSLGLFAFCAQCAWLMLWRAGRVRTRMTQAVGWVFMLFCLVSLIRILIILASPNPSNDFFQSGLYDTLILMGYQILLIFLAFCLALMVNRWLHMEVKTQEEKFTKAFHSSPYAILITRLSDGLILDVNPAFEKISGYLSSEVIGKTSLDLHLWVKDTDRLVVTKELSVQGEVQGREFQFRMKSGLERTGLYYAEIIVVKDEQLMLSSISDITERKKAEGTIRSLARYPAENPNPVLRIARDGNLLYANEAAFVLLKDWKLELGQPTPEVLKDPTREVFEARKPKMVQVPCGERIFSMVISEVPEEEYVNLYGLDDTDRKRAEQALQVSQEELRLRIEELNERTREIERLNVDLNRLVDHDDLTGVYNRRFFNEYFEIEVRRMKNFLEHKDQLEPGHKNDMNFGLAMIDIDRFKRVNDTCGHLVGDDILKQVIEIIERNIFSRDVLCRYGGDEFALLLTKTSDRGILQAAEKIRKEIDEHAFVFREDQEHLHVTISVGLVAFDEVLNQGSEGILKLADDRLLRAKSLGRNRIVYTDGS